jgi:hypothetical protein
MVPNKLAAPLNKLKRKSIINLPWLMGFTGLVVLVGFTGVIVAQSPQPHEPLPRTFEGIQKLMAPPVELQGIRLLMTPDEVRVILKKNKLQLKEDKGTLAGINLQVIHAIQPMHGFQVFSFQFQEGKLYNMLIEYDMRNFSLDFEAYLAQLKSKYGEPVEVKDIMKEEKAPAPLHTFDSFIHRWVDEKTELEIVYTPPGGKDPLLSRSIPADVLWKISDRVLAEKNREDNAARFKPKKELTDEERKEAQKKFLKELEQRKQQQQ